MKMRIATLSLTILCLALASTAFAAELYNDGPTDGTTNAFIIDGPSSGAFEQTISDGFVASGSGSASSLDFVMWVAAGSTPTTATWALGTSEFGSDISSGSHISGTTLLCTNGSSFHGGICAGGFGFDVYNVHFDDLSGSLTAGSTYWLTLGGGNDSFGTQFDGWDVNNGPADCEFAVAGVPQGNCGAGGESFTLNGGTSSTPEPSSIMLLGSGILGFAGVLRRKLGR